MLKNLHFNSVQKRNMYKEIEGLMKVKGKKMKSIFSVYI